MELTYWYQSIQEIRRAHSGHWFDRDTLRFFKSRISEVVYGGRFFVTSEKSPNDKRRYSIRIAHSDGRIDTIGGFQGYATSKSAHKAAEELGSPYLKALRSLNDEDRHRVIYGH